MAQRCVQSKAWACPPPSGSGWEKGREKANGVGPGEQKPDVYWNQTLRTALALGGFGLGLLPKSSSQGWNEEEGEQKVDDEKCRWALPEE